MQRRRRGIRKRELGRAEFPIASKVGTTDLPLRSCRSQRDLRLSMPGTRARNGHHGQLGVEVPCSLISGIPQAIHRHPLSPFTRTVHRSPHEIHPEPPRRHQLPRLDALGIGGDHRRHLLRACSTTLANSSPRPTAGTSRSSSSAIPFRARSQHRRARPVAGHAGRQAAAGAHLHLRCACRKAASLLSPGAGLQRRAQSQF